MAYTPTEEEIAVLMSRLVTNWTELMNNYFDIFINERPKMVSLQLIDSKGNVTTINIPNRAMDRQYILNGNGIPTDVILGSIGSIYQDLTNGEVYINKNGTKNGWIKLINKKDLESIILQGMTNPEGQINANKGTLYINMSAGTLFIKQTEGVSNTGWVEFTNSQPYMPISPLDTTSGIINLSYGGVYALTPTGNVTFQLGTPPDNEHLYELLIQLNLTDINYTIDVGTDYYFANSEPNFETTGFYTINYEYDVLAGKWACGVLKKN